MQLWETLWLARVMFVYMSKYGRSFKTACALYRKRIHRLLRHTQTPDLFCQSNNICSHCWCPLRLLCSHRVHTGHGLSTRILTQRNIRVTSGATTMSVTAGCWCVPDKWALLDNPDYQKAMRSRCRLVLCHQDVCLSRHSGLSGHSWEASAGRNNRFSSLECGQGASANVISLWRASSGCGRALCECSNVLSFSSSSRPICLFGLGVFP